MFPTGDIDQPDTVTVTLTVAVNKNTTADDWLLDALTGSLIRLTFPDAWSDAGYTITADQAAAAAQAMWDSMVIT
jgi:hypothetical protein